MSASFKKMSLFLLYLLVFTSRSKGADQDRTDIILTDSQEQDETDSKELPCSEVDPANTEAFQPTSQWQTIQEGQSIPAGLHVRMNLETGKKEAKLMPEGEEGDAKGDVEGDVKGDVEESKSGPNIVQVDKIDKQRVEEALKNFEDKFHHQNEDLNNMSEEEEKAYKEELLKKYRSIDDIKMDLEGYNMFPKTDAQIMLEHVQVLNDSDSTVEQRQHALDELEFLVHQVDNARDLDIIGGLQLVVKALNDSVDEIRLRAAFVLGSATQSNPPVQGAALRMGAIPTLLKLLSSPQQSLLVRRKVMYALSSHVRLFKAGKKQFIQFQGMDVLLKLFDQYKTEPLRLKGVTLLTDLITEEVNELRKKPKNKYLSDEALAKKSSLLPRMAQGGWCEKIISLLDTTENDVREKVLQTLHLVSQGCLDVLGQAQIFSKIDKLAAELRMMSIKEEEPDNKKFLELLSKSASDLLNKLL